MKRSTVRLYQLEILKNTIEALIKGHCAGMLTLFLTLNTVINFVMNFMIY